MKTFPRLAIALAALAVLTTTTPAQQPPVPPADTVVHAGRLIDGTSTTVREQVSILVAGERILDVQPGFVRPPGAKVVDLSRSTVMPGFIDSHTHITSELGPNAIVEAVTRGAVDAACPGSRWGE